MISGFLNINKEKGITSNKVLSKIKRILRDNNIQTKVGHFGTLDPDGEGVLPIALGRATRLFDYTTEKIKVYYTEFLFGIMTDTNDTSGKILEENVVYPTKEEILSQLNKLIGTIDQIPPIYSAKSVNGVKAYALARKGIDVELKAKEIEIYDIKLLEQLNINKFSLEIRCSGGTYIRSIARDLGVLTNSLCVMSYINRLQSGVFKIENSYKLEDLEQNLTEKILPLELLIEDYPKFFVPDYKKTLILNGVKVKFENLPQGNFTVYIDEELVGIANEIEGALVIKSWLK